MRETAQSLKEKYPLLEAIDSGMYDCHCPKIFFLLLFLPSRSL
jgi:hypothetical protein